MKIIKYISSRLDRIIIGPKISPPPYSEKITIIREYARSEKINTLVETGTYLGDTLFNLKDDFKRLFSIELDTDLFNKAVLRFKPYGQVTILQGDSGIILEMVMKKIDCPTIFWLDGHYSGGITAKGDLDSPIKREIYLILNHYIKTHVVLIDDARCFNGRNGYPTISELVKHIKSKSTNFHLRVENDIIRIIFTKTGGYQIKYKKDVRVNLNYYYVNIKNALKKIIKYEKN